MRKISVIILLTVISQLTNAQVLKDLVALASIGESKSTIKSELVRSGAHLSEGLNKEGYTYLMDEDWDGVIAYFFNDNLVCVSWYYSARSKKGRQTIINLKDAVGKELAKVEDNVYSKDGINVRFGTGAEGVLTMEVTKIRG